jgi:hypothetical protein
MQEDQSFTRTLRISRPALPDDMVTSRDFGRSLELGLAYDARADVARVSPLDMSKVHVTEEEERSHYFNARVIKSQKDMADALDANGSLSVSYKIFTGSASGYYHSTNTSSSLDVRPWLHSMITLAEHVLVHMFCAFRVRAPLQQIVAVTMPCTFPSLLNPSVRALVDCVLQIRMMVTEKEYRHTRWADEAALQEGFVGSALDQKKQNWIKMLTAAKDTDKENTVKEYVCQELERVWDEYALLPVRCRHSLSS